MVASVSIFAYIIAGTLINALGKKTLAGTYIFFAEKLKCKEHFSVILSVTAACCAFGMYFAQNTAVVLTVSSIFIAAASVNTNVMLSVVVDAFPTTLR